MRVNDVLVLLPWVALVFLGWLFLNLFWELIKARGKMAVTPQLMAALALVYAGLSYGAR